MIKTLAYGDEKLFYGTINKIYPVLDSESKTEQLKINMNNKGYMLKPGMYTNVYVSVPAGRGNYPAVPSEAVIFDDDKDYVVVVDKNNVLSYRTIKLIKETNTLDYVASGLTAGDKIIVHNALLVYNSLK